jgi:hypothetical protein
LALEALVPAHWIAWAVMTTVWVALFAPVIVLRPAIAARR